MLAAVEQRRLLGCPDQPARKRASLNASMLIELAKLLAKQGRYQESDQTVARAEKIEPNSPRFLYATADLYIKSGRHIDTARTLL